MKLLQGINYFFGPLFNSNNTYLNHSLLYLNRKRKIDRNYMDYVRLSTLELIAEEIKSGNLTGAVAELGVYKGKFARYINEYFPERKLYLFDTFEGFDKKDINIEKLNAFSKGDQDFSNTSVNEVLKRMPYPHNCIIKKGYFPESATNIDEEFVFVSIDTDLFDPIYNGLKFFYPRVKKGGYIFVHDYNNDNYQGSKSAVNQFCKENNISKLPLPDAAGTAVLIK